MAIKPTYEALEQRVKGLEKEAYKLKQVDEALRESEEKYRSLLDDVIDSSDAGLFILDSDFKVVWVNQALDRYFGLKREEVVGKNKRQLIQEQIKYSFDDPEGFVERVLATYDNNTYVEKFECHVLSGKEYFPKETRFILNLTIPSDVIKELTDSKRPIKCDGSMVRSTSKGMTIQFDRELQIMSLKGS